MIDPNENPGEEKTTNKDVEGQQTDKPSENSTSVEIVGTRDEIQSRIEVHGSDGWRDRNGKRIWPD